MTSDLGDPSTQTTARGRVREDLRRMILSGEFKPGTRLTQQNLAKRFGVAQSVVRESLLELQFSGLVESVDNLGIFVSDLDVNRLLQAYEVREMLEGLAARRCCERASRADIRGLMEQAEKIYELGAAGNDVERGRLDRKFHLTTIAISQNQILAKLTESYLLLGMILTVSRPHDVIREEHQAIVKAIEANKPEDAERLARAHVAGVRKSIQQQIADGQFVPVWVFQEDRKAAEEKPKKVAR
jgi:DNA-binding GntR family transcriptional regulator